jgi:UDP-N-acetylglucosamine 2-epimerase (non-hydrolysing)
MSGEVNPDVILAQGDTTTTFVASLAAFYHKVAFGHVEAGLRTDNKYDPFPEEMNRRLTGSLADFHFAPTRQAKENLLREGVKESAIYVTGNTVIDALNIIAARPYTFEDEVLLNAVSGREGRLVLVTAHRRENWGEPLESICTALRDIVRKHEDVELVYLVHLNPVVSETAKKILGNEERVHLLPPLDIKETHNLMDRCFMVMTDSGGLQEEAPHLGKPVLVLRDVTERPEAVEAGTVRIIGTQKDRVFEEACLLLDNKDEYNSMSNAVNPYGDGHASVRIAESLLYYFHIIDKRPGEFVPGD